MAGVVLKRISSVEERTEKAMRISAALPRVQVRQRARGRAHREREGARRRPKYALPTDYWPLSDDDGAPPYRAKDVIDAT